VRIDISGPGWAPRRTRRRKGRREKMEGELGMRKTGGNHFSIPDFTLPLPFVFFVHFVVPLKAGKVE
jgi:hypothetical protein